MFFSHYEFIKCRTRLLVIINIPVYDRPANTLLKFLGQYDPQKKGQGQN